MELILDKWSDILEKKISTTETMKIISPSCSMVTMEILNTYNVLHMAEFITRFSLYDFFVKLSDLKALKLAVDKGMNVYGVKYLHCKTYIFNDKEAIITSSNFTWGGIYRNHECGILVDDAVIIKGLLEYFFLLKNEAGPELSLADCEKWEDELSIFKADILTPSMMPDYGKEISVR